MPKFPLPLLPTAILAVFAGLIAIAYLPFGLIYLQKFSFKAPPVYHPPANIQGLAVSSASGMIKYPDDYTLVLVGDSMTEYLGNADELRGYLSQDYAGKSIEVLNYGFGSTNVLSLPERFSQTSQHGRAFRPIDDIDYNLVLIESMGNNPLSQYPLAEGLQRQNQALDQTITEITRAHNRAKIVFVATIAPNSDQFAAGTTAVLSPQQRQQWVKERDAYIENHIKYAHEHNIPVIDIYDASKDWRGEGKFIFISQTDHIHPSPTGVLFISKQIADFIAKHNLLPEK